MGEPEVYPLTVPCPLMFKVKGAVPPVILTVMVLLPLGQTLLGPVRDKTAAEAGAVTVTVANTAELQALLHGPVYRA